MLLVMAILTTVMVGPMLALSAWRAPRIPAASTKADAD